MAEGKKLEPVPKTMTPKLWVLAAIALCAFLLLHVEEAQSAGTPMVSPQRLEGAVKIADVDVPFHARQEAVIRCLAETGPCPPKAMLHDLWGPILQLPNGKGGSFVFHLHRKSFGVSFDEEPTSFEEFRVRRQLAKRVRVVDRNRDGKIDLVIGYLEEDAQPRFFLPGDENFDWHLARRQKEFENAVTLAWRKIGTGI